MRFHASPNRRHKYLCLFFLFCLPSFSLILLLSLFLSSLLLPSFIFLFLFVPLSLLRHSRAHVCTCTFPHVPSITGTTANCSWLKCAFTSSQETPNAGQSASNDVPSTSRERATSLIGAIINLPSRATSKSHTRCWKRK